MEAWRVRAAEWSSCSVQSGLTLRTSVPSGMLDAHANGTRQIRKVGVGLDYGKTWSACTSRKIVRCEPV